MSTSSTERKSRPKIMTNARALISNYLLVLQTKLFDLLLGVSTEGTVITKQSIFTAGGEYSPYQGSQWWPVRRSLKALHCDSDDIFIDLGSGKGKALLIAGRLPFRQVIGVELDDELAQLALDNIEKARPRLRALDVKAVNANVLEWTIPDNVSVVFMANPFIGETFHSVLARIFESYDRRPRNLHVVYSCPWEHDWLVSTGRVVVEDVRPSYWPAFPGWWRNGSVLVSYRIVGISGSEKAELRESRSSLRRRKAIRYWSNPNNHRFSMAPKGYKPVQSRSSPQ